MQSRRDQVQAQSYVVSRVTAALVAAEPDGPESPHRRTVVGTISGALVAALVVAGFVVFGFMSPGAAGGWRAPGTLIVEKETGNRYVLAGDRLHPVLNYASALLLFKDPPQVVSVSRKSLRQVTHGAAVGIVGAPDALPAAGAVARQVWTVCALVTHDPAGAVTTATTLAVDQQARPDRPLGPDEALVAAGGEQTFLVWRGRRLRLTQPWIARALGYDAAALPVGAGWLESVPVGPDVVPVTVPGRGGAGPPVDGGPSRIGELFVSRSPERFFVLQSDGLTELTPVAYALVAADPSTAGLYAGKPAVPRELSPGALTSLPVSRRSAVPAEVPANRPALVQAPEGRTWCVRQSMADGRVEVTAAPPVPASGVAIDVVGVTRDVYTAAVVGIAPGVGGLVLPGRVDQAAGTEYFLVTDAGVKYPLAGAAVARKLGYPPESARPVPRRLLEMLPTGPLLRPAPSGG